MTSPITIRAHPDLIVKPYLKGHERVSLLGLADLGADRDVRSATRRGLSLDFVTEEGVAERERMNLDTVFLDIAAKNPRRWRVFLSWRVNFEPDLFETAVIIQRPAAGADSTQKGSEAT